MRLIYVNNFTDEGLLFQGKALSVVILSFCGNGCFQVEDAVVLALAQLRRPNLVRAGILVLVPFFCVNQSVMEFNENHKSTGIVEDESVLSSPFSCL